ncbi:hypothetical protein F5Y16DRAFT_394079 [Xylariaceae sp. FL0255]|nr:hypothetical protein F5Y16DRAFT_394079 [Xylariaceae sp. FL0255]
MSSPQSLPFKASSLPAPPPALASMGCSNILGDKEASDEGHGTEEALQITKVLEDANITCCCVRISALIFYGAERLRPVCQLGLLLLKMSSLTIHIMQDWEICVPTDLVDKAAEVLQSESLSNEYCLVDPWAFPTTSLLHMYTRSKIKGVNFYFIIVPANDVHIVCEPSNLTQSSRGLPYPKLDVFIQSCLDMSNELMLSDVINGTNFTRTMGEDNFDLDGFSDAEG